MNRSHASQVRAAALPAIALLLLACSAGSGPQASPPGTALATAAATATPAATVAPPPPTPRPTPTPVATRTIVLVTPIPDAPDSGVVLDLVSVGNRWSASAISAPAGAVWHVEIDNQDADTNPHNFIVSSGPSFQERIFTSENFGSGTHKFQVPALPAGSYMFKCSLHPSSMTGQLVLE